MTEPEGLRQAVRDRYGRIGERLPVLPSSPGPSGGCCEGASSSWCGDSSGASCCSPGEVASALGYATEDLQEVPSGANLGLGCGNPTGLLSLREGETVLDLGSGGGVDCFIAAKRVGPTGKVIGVDMTPEMIARARANARMGEYPNVEFRLGEIEHLPVPDRSVDVVLSNCVINLAIDKAEVYREAFRVLRPGGRLAVSDVVATRPIPRESRSDPSQWSSCSSGALEEAEVEPLLRSVGFDQVEVRTMATGAGLASLAAQDALGVVPGSIRAVRPPGS